MPTIALLNQAGKKVKDITLTKEVLYDELDGYTKEYEVGDYKLSMGVKKLWVMNIQ